MSSFNPTVINCLNVRINVVARMVPPISKYKKVEFCKNLYFKFGIVPVSDSDFGSSLSEALV
jgi:hypothetical protein